MPQKVEHIISDEGKILRRVTSESILKIDDAVLSTLTAGSPVRIKWVHQLKNKYVMDLVIKGPMIITVAQMYYLDLKMPFKLVEGYMVPDILNKENPRITIPFTAFGNCNIVVATTCNYASGIGYQPSSCYLLFRDVSRGNFYLPPLPNLYDDGRVCVGGSEVMETKPTLDVLTDQSIHIIEDAPWGSHLPKPEGATQQMFRFKPKNDGFVHTAPPVWQEHCTKVANDITSLISF